MKEATSVIDCSSTFSTLPVTSVHGSISRLELKLSESVVSGWIESVIIRQPSAVPIAYAHGKVLRAPISQPDDRKQ